MPRSPSLARDAALQRMHRINRWLLAGTVAVTGILTDVAAQAFPGHTIRRTTVASPARAATPERRDRHAHHHRALTPPAQAPQAQTSAPAAPAPSTPAPVPSTPAPAPAPAPIVSGGS